MDEANYRWKYYNRNTLRIIMKKIQILTVFMMLIHSLASCQTVVDLHDHSYPINEPNIYYKDIGDKFNPYTGTWVYDDGVNYIKIVLMKKIKAPIWTHYEDYLIGAFQYKKNGTDVINTLNTLNSNLADVRDYLIQGNLFSNSPTSTFHQYTSDNRRIKLGFKENGCHSDINVRTLTLNGQPAIQIDKFKTLELGQICTPVIPAGFYYLIKQ